MRWVHVFIVLITLSMISSLVLYATIPVERVPFSVEESNPNFTLPNESGPMQYYPNMRFPTTEITYHIADNCSIKKKQDMREAFDYLANLTVLNFEEVQQNEDITVVCQNENIVDNGMFVAGEGGPTEVYKGGSFVIIKKGKILLIRDSKCPKPNMPVHELLHVLGFGHSKNKQNIMYPVSECYQTIGEEIPAKINEVYSTPPYPDLYFQNVTGDKHGPYVDLSFVIRNGGLTKSGEAELYFYANGREFKTMKIKALGFGQGLAINLTNLATKTIKLNELTMSIKTDFEELSKENNNVTLFLD